MVTSLYKIIPDLDIQDWDTAIQRLKHLPRQTWVLNRVPSGETVAAHTVGVMFNVLNLAIERGLSVEDALLYALVHDLPEIIMGDLTLGQKTALGQDALDMAEGRSWQQLLAIMPKNIRDRVLHLMDNIDPQVRQAVDDADQADLYTTAKQYGVDLL